MINIESKWNKVFFSKSKYVTITWHTKKNLNSSNVKRPNSNYDNFVEKRAYKETEETWMPEILWN